MLRLGGWGTAPTLVALALAGSAWSGADRGADLSYPDIEIETVTLGGHITNLTRNPALDTSPAVSRDGTRIAFVSSRDGRPDVYTMRSDGTDVERVTTSPFPGGGKPLDTSAVAWNDAGHTTISWAPDGSRIAFDAQNATVPAECMQNCFIGRVLVVKPDGSGLRFVADYAEAPSWSPDGLRLAFENPVDPDLESLGITISTLASGAKVHLKASAYDFFDPPAWSRTGLLAFAALTGEQPPLTIQTIRANGTHRRKLVTGFQPVWSPSGATLAFIRDSRLYTVAVAGGPAKRLTGKEQAALPAWSPDGKWIAYLRYTGKPAQAQLAVVPGGGGAERVLTHFAKGSVFDTRPVWTAGSKRVVFTVFHLRQA